MSRTARPATQVAPAGVLALARAGTSVVRAPGALRAAPQAEREPAAIPRRRHAGTEAVAAVPAPPPHLHLLAERQQEGRAQRPHPCSSPGEDRSAVDNSHRWCEPNFFSSFLFLPPKAMHNGLWDGTQEWTPAQRESYLHDVAMIVVAVPHVCSFAWLLCWRSSHGLLCAFGSSLALEAALLWWFLSDAATPRRIMCQTVGLALAGLWLVVQVLLDSRGWTGTAGARNSSADEGGARKEEGIRIIGAEQWLIAWSMSSWAALLYGAPCVFALLRQGVDATMATFGCYLLFIALGAQLWVFVGGTGGSDVAVDEGRQEDSSHECLSTLGRSGTAPKDCTRPRRRDRETTRRSLEVLRHPSWHAVQDCEICFVRVCCTATPRKRALACVCARVRAAIQQA